MFKSGDKFQYIPASVYPVNHGGLAIYIKYKTNPSRHIILKETSSRHSLFQCPDRDILFVSDSNRAWQNRYFEYDEVVNANQCWETDPQNSNYMVNFTQYYNRISNSPNLRKNGRSSNSGVIFSDSGGYQIQSEQLDYINPKHLVEWYNDNVDIGIVLDIPHSRYRWDDIRHLAAQAQAKNIDVMLQYKKPELELMNVAHGFGVPEALEFIKIVDRPEINRLCIAGGYFETLLKSIYRAVKIFKDARPFEHYHMLGVSKLSQIIPYIRMATKGLAPFITSDSSTWLQESLTMKYYNWTTITSAPRYYPIGKDTNIPNSKKILSCSCPICSAVKYQDIFACFQQNILGFFLGMHNQYAFQSYVQTMYQIVEEASLKDLKSLMRSQFITRSSVLEESLACVDFVDTVVEEGLDCAERKFQLYLGTSSTNAIVTTTTLFNQVQVSQEDEDLPSDHVKSRMEVILKSYIGEGLKKDSVIKNKNVKHKQKKGHNKHSSGTITRPGKKKKKKKLV